MSYLCALQHLAEYAAEMTDHFFEHETLLRAQLATGLGSAVRALRKAPRSRRIAAVLRDAVERAAQARELAALVDTIARAESIIALRDQHGLSPKRTRAVLSWLLRSMSEAVERGDTPVGSHRSSAELFS